MEGACGHFIYQGEAHKVGAAVCCTLLPLANFFASKFFLHFFASLFFCNIFTLLHWTLGFSQHLSDTGNFVEFIWEILHLFFTFNHTIRIKLISINFYYMFLFVLTFFAYLTLAAGMLTNRQQCCFSLVKNIGGGKKSRHILFVASLVKYRYCWINCDMSSI